VDMETIVAEVVKLRTSCDVNPISHEFDYDRVPGTESSTPQHGVVAMPQTQIRSRGRF
jgi:hypothetical protein